MPLSYPLLDALGTNEKRFEELFSANPNKLPKNASEEEVRQNRLDVEMRRKIEELIASRIDEAILNNLKSSHLHGAVDLAWDSSTITRKTVPLVMYAQRRIAMQECVTSLEQLQCDRAYVKRDKAGRPVSVDCPKPTEVNVNLVRSIITRRVAAQSARFTNLYPFFKYETRGTSEGDKLRGDLLSQRVDIMADQYGYRTGQIGWTRDMLLYPHTIVFPSCKWDREVEWYLEDDDLAEEFKTGSKTPKSRVRREGVPMVAPHPSRVFYDVSHPVGSINSDTGCEWFGFWDVVRFSEIDRNYDYFNRRDIGYYPDASNWFYSYSPYFSQYFCTVNPPCTQEQLSQVNDRKAVMGLYTSDHEDASVYRAHFYWKIKPNQWRLGDYPHDVWMHLTVANSHTVVHAEVMPDCPGFVYQYNGSTQRLLGLSMAHDIMPFQDQLTNLYSELLECVKRDLFGITILNLDAFPTDNPDALKALNDFRTAMDGDDFFSKITRLEVSLIKMKDLGVDFDRVFRLYRQDSGRQLSEIIQAISQTIALSERVMALSPQEQAQLSPRETSATEVQIIAGTTENIYQFISDAIDEGRAAMKRYIYNALISLGSEEIELPVINRYRKAVAEKEGFRVTDLETVNSIDSTSPRQFSVQGSKRNLIAEYIFNSRDGADRASNIQSAQTLTQLLGILMQPAILAKLTNENMAEIINAIIRQSGAGVDVVIEPQPGEGPNPVMPPQQPMEAPQPTGPQVTPMNGGGGGNIGMSDASLISLPRS